MWEEITERFQSEPAKQEVVEFLLRRGYSVDEEMGVHADGIELNNQAIAEEVGVDRRTVGNTIESILADEELRAVFENLSTIPFLREAAPVLGLHVIEVRVSEPGETGLLSAISDVFADHGVLIRQAVVEDPYFSPRPTFVAIVGDFDSDLITELNSLAFVESVVCK